MGMTVKEAASVLSTVVSNLQAARRLEEALVIAVAADQAIKEKTAAKEELEGQLAELNKELIAIGREIEEEGRRRISILDETLVKVEEANIRVSKCQERAALDIKALEDEADQKLQAITGRSIDLEGSLAKEISSKEEDLVSILNKLSLANAEMASVKERLG